MVSSFVELFSVPLRELSIFLQFDFLVFHQAQQKLSISIQFVNLPNCSFFRTQFSFVDLCSKFISRSPLRSIPRLRPIKSTKYSVSTYCIRSLITRADLPRGEI